MKNNLLKYYIAVFYFCSTFVMFADPGIDDEDGALENVDPAAPIDDYVWVLFAIGILFVFLKFRALYKQTSSQE
jgi:hypothetical protein